MSDNCCLRIVLFPLWLPLAIVWVLLKGLWKSLVWALKMLGELLTGPEKQPRPTPIQRQMTPQLQLRRSTTQTCPTILSPELEEVVFLTTSVDLGPEREQRVQELIERATRKTPSPDAWYLRAKVGRASFPTQSKCLVDSYKADLRFKRSCLRKALKLDPGHTKSRLFLNYLTGVERRVKPEYWYIFIFHRLGFPLNMTRNYISPVFVHQPKSVSAGDKDAWPPEIRGAFLKAMDERGAFWFRPFERILRAHGMKWETVLILAEASRHYASQSPELVARYQECLRQLEEPETCPACQQVFLPLEQSAEWLAPASLCEICWWAINLKEDIVEDWSQDRKRISIRYRSILKGVDLTPAQPEPMKADLKRVAELTQTLPLIGEATMWETVAPENVGDLARLLWRMQPKRAYTKLFGSSFRANVEAGVLDAQATLPSTFGARCLAADGHECHSLAERVIDDWLYINGVAHEREPLYPQDPNLNANGLLRADWLVGETFIEYFGLAGQEEYDSRVDRKRKLARRRRLRLVEIMPEDLATLDRKLGHLRNRE